MLRWQSDGGGEVSTKVLSLPAANWFRDEDASEHPVKVLPARKVFWKILHSEGFQQCAISTLNTCVPTVNTYLILLLSLIGTSVDCFWGGGYSFLLYDKRRYWEP